MIRALIRVRLDHDSPTDLGDDLGRRDRHALSVLQAAPGGSRVVVAVGKRRPVTVSAVAGLRWAAARHAVEIEAADARTGDMWRAAVLRGEPW